ncbi:hypothetical protein [Bosea sp. 2RAB26]|uniref:hypothetical protein n=1 Tax=Bosea sp. 2RAB26 TaxID=3237476 RepID=UPI003F903397
MIAIKQEVASELQVGARREYGSPMLTRDEIWILQLFRSDTGRVDLRPSKSREELIRKGLIEWTPAPSWAGFNTYALTDRGRAVMGVLPKAPVD